MKPLFGSTTPVRSSVRQSAPAPVIREQAEGIHPVPVQQHTRNVVAKPANWTTDVTKFEEQGANKINRAKSTSGQILEMTKTSTLTVVGEKLTEVVLISKKLDPKDLQEKGLLGKIFGNLQARKEKFFAQHRSVKEQIGVVTKDLEGYCKQQKTQIDTLDKLFGETEEDYTYFGQCVEDGQMLMQQLESELEQMLQQEGADAFHGQRVADHRALINRVSKRITDYQLAQTLTFQDMPQIRMMQENARAMVNTFRDLVDVTVPAWEKQFSLQVLHLEQQHAAKVANTVYDMSEELIRKNAEMLNQNAGEIARVSNRQMVSIETLEYAQTQLVEGITNASNIVKEAQQQRAVTFQRAQEMQGQLVDKLKG